MKYLQGYRKLDKFFILFSIYISSLITSIIYNNIDLTLTNFTGRTIGQTILFGIDAGARTFSYVKLILSFVIIFFTILLPLLYVSYLLKKSSFKITMKKINLSIIASSSLNYIILLFVKPFSYKVYILLWTGLIGFYYLWLSLKKFNTSHSSTSKPNFLKEKIHTKIEKKVVFVLSILLVFYLLLMIMDFRQVYLYLFSALFMFLIICIIIIQIKKSTSINNTIFPQIFRNYNIMTISFLFPLILFFMIQIIINGEFNFKIIYFPLYLLYWLLFYLFYYLIIAFSNKKGISIKLINTALITAGVPLIFIPFFIPVINEFQFTISHIFDIGPRFLAIVFMIVLFIISLAIFILYIKKKRIYMNCSHLIKNIYFPAIVATSVLYKNFSHYLEKDILDMFHLGENLLPVQQLFSSGKIPMVHVYPTHNFSNIIVQIFYAAINGYRAMEPWAWNWIYYVVGFVLLYFLLKKILDPITALFTSIFLPIFPVFDPYYSVLIIPAFALIYLLKKQTFKRYTIFWIINLFIYLWRIDFGLATMAAGIFIILIYNLGYLINHYQKKSLNIKKIIKIRIKNIGFSFLTVFGSGLLIYCTIIIACGESIADVLGQNIQFLKIQAPSMAYKDMYREFGPSVIFQYLALPALGIFYICHFIYNSIIKRKSLSYKQLLMIFLAALSLIMSVRSVQRHSLMEHFSPYLFIFLLMCLPLYLNKIKRNYAYILFFLVLLVYLIVFPSHLTRTWDGGILEAHYSHFIQIPETKIYNFNKWNNRESRLRINNSQYRDLVAFINNHLQPEQTFYDFTNYPLLYVVADRKFPVYFIPNFYHTSEKIQKITVGKLSKLHQKNQLPLIIFKNNTWWDFVDNVPNEIRSYRITEFIYRNYRPFININNYQLWLDKNIDQSQFNTNNYNSVTYLNQHFDLKKLPYIWGNYDPEQATTNKIQQTLVDEKITLNQYDFIFYHIDPDIDKSKGNYLHLKIKAKATDTVDIIYGKNTRRMISFTVIPSTDYIDYLIRISSQWQWMNNDIDTLIIDSKKDLKIGGIYLRQGD